jgi:hypothetical protein
MIQAFPHADWIAASSEERHSTLLDMPHQALLLLPR